MEDSIGRILADASRLMRKYFDIRARNIGVTRPQWQVLIMLEKHEGCNQGSLADLLEVEPITLCRMVDRLQGAGLVERRRNPEDRRAWQLYLTPRAAVILEDLQPIISEVIHGSLEGISLEEQELLKSLLNKIRNNLATQAQSTDSGRPDSLKSAVIGE